MHSNISRIHQCLSTRFNGVALSSGVTSWFDSRGIIIAVLYCLGSGLMATDAWYGDHLFVWRQGFIVLVISYIIVAALAWELNMLGIPRGMNLLLQLLLIFPLALFLGRTIGLAPPLPEDPTILNVIKDMVYHGMKFIGILNLVPEWSKEIVRSPYLAAMIVLVCIAISVPYLKARMALLASIIVLPALYAGVYYTPSLSFWLGAGLAGFGVCLQWLDVNTMIAQITMLTRLNTLADEAERRCALRVFDHALTHGEVAERSVTKIVQRCYSSYGIVSNEDVSMITHALIDHLVHEYGVLQLRGNARGIVLIPSPDLTRFSSLLSEISVWPRRIIITIVALSWVLMPLDFLPDAIPVVGVIDDVFIALLGGSVSFTNAIAHRRGAAKD